ncbi:MAG: DUF2812 domain-containing protein [Flavonifractor plautii]
MKPRTVRRLCLVDGMNLDHIEGWLESMAARGLHYDHSDAFLFHFRRGEPAAVRYRLEPRGTLDCPEGMEHCRTLGWELTGYMGKGFSLFRTWEPDAPELHTDPVVPGVRAGQAGKAGSVVRHPHANLRPWSFLPSPYGSFWPGMSRYCPWVAGSGDNPFSVSCRSGSPFICPSAPSPPSSPFGGGCGPERNPGAPAGGVPPASTPPVWPAPLSWWPSALPSWQPGVACAGRGRLRP